MVQNKPCSVITCKSLKPYAPNLINTPASNTDPVIA